MTGVYWKTFFVGANLTFIVDLKRRKWPIRYMYRLNFTLHDLIIVFQKMFSL